VIEKRVQGPQAGGSSDGRRAGRRVDASALAAWREEPRRRCRLRHGLSKAERREKEIDNRRGQEGQRSLSGTIPEKSKAIG